MKGRKSSPRSKGAKSRLMATWLWDRALSLVTIHMIYILYILYIYIYNIYYILTQETDNSCASLRCGRERKSIHNTLQESLGGPYTLYRLAGRLSNNNCLWLGRCRRRSSATSQPQQPRRRCKPLTRDTRDVFPFSMCTEHRWSITDNLSWVQRPVAMCTMYVISCDLYTNPESICPISYSCIFLFY